MEEIKLKRITLFILEIIILQQGRCIDESFVEQINDYIYKYYDEHKELFGLLFDNNLLEEFIENKWEILPYDVMIGLIKKYHGFEGYVNILDTVGYEVDQKMNILVMKFLDYYNELLELRYAKSSTYPRILQ